MPDSWHYKHMWDPRDTSPGSIMPRYPWLITNKLDRGNTVAKMETMVKLGVPYEEEDFENMTESMDQQAIAIEKSVFADAAEIKARFEKESKEKGEDFVPLRDREITALIAYLQRLGTDISTEQTETTGIIGSEAK